MESTEEVGQDLAAQLAAVKRTQQKLAEKVALLKMLKDAVEVAYSSARGLLEQTIDPGAVLKTKSPLDKRVLLGTCTLTDPKNETSIVDQAAFLEWVARHYNDKVSPVFVQVGTWEQIADVLYDVGRKDLMTLVDRVDPEFVRDIRIRSSEMGFPIGPADEMDIPGVKVSAADPVLRCLPGKRAKGEFTELIRSGAVSIDDLLGGA